MFQILPNSFLITVMSLIVDGVERTRLCQGLSGGQRAAQADKSWLPGTAEASDSQAKSLPPFSGCLLFAS